MLKGSLEVIEFEPRQTLGDAVVPPHSPESQDLLSRLHLEPRTLMSCAAALVALALHILLIAPAFLRGGPFRHSQEQRHGGDTALQWVVLEDSSGHSAIMGTPSLPPLTMRAMSVADALPTLPTEVSEEQPDGQSGLGAMSGRYLGQIRARIERAWLRPRSAIGDPIFQCQVQVDQNSVGRVVAVTLVECNGGSSWQLSLVHAIEAASPLPAPPNPAVFVHHVLLTFRAMAYSPGALAQLYEPASALTDERNAQSEDAIQALGEAVRAHSGKDVELRIEGSKVEVEPDRE